jgi:hypothetical protein
MADAAVVEKGCRVTEGDTEDHLEAMEGVLVVQVRSKDDRVVDRAGTDGILGRHVVEVRRSEYSAKARMLASKGCVTRENYQVSEDEDSHTKKTPSVVGECWP